MTDTDSLLERYAAIQKENVRLEVELCRLRTTTISQSEIEAMQAAIRFIMSPSVGIFSEVREEVCGKIQTVINRLGPPSDELATLRDLRDSWYGVREMMQKQIRHLESEVERLRAASIERLEVASE